ncbi:MAG TPA: hypothetical protein VGT44_09760 [Ktedonobacteraceae bacterium]|nr:hypothetical protein [Ktedonobacteraceae bacterium]
MITRQRKLIRLPIVGIILLGVFAGVYLFAGKRSSKPAAPSRIVKHTVETPPDEALAYWTAEKMRNAKPAPMPNVKAPDRKKRPPRRPSSRPPQA